MKMTILLWVLSAATAFAQSTPAPVFIYSYGDEGAASVVADALEAGIGKGLAKQCVDWTTETAVRYLLEWERQSELLGNEADQERLANVAALLGARYVLAIVAFTQPGGQISTSVWLFDRETGRRVAERQGSPASGEAALEGTNSLIQSILQDLSRLFEGGCREHWSGTITYSFVHQSGEAKTNRFAGGDGGINTSTTSQSWRTEQVIEAFIQSGTGEAGEQNRAIARVVHQYEHRDEYERKDNQAVWCRPRGADSHWERLDGRRTINVDERGRSADTARIFVDRAEKLGTFTISVPYPALTTRWHREETNIPLECGGQAKPKSEVTDGEDSPESEEYAKAGILEVRGRLDFENPDILSGREVSGDLEHGQTTKTWSLRRMKSKGGAQP